MGSTIFAAERAPDHDIRYQRIFFVPECPICLEALTADDTVQTTCNHLFHRRCLEAALARNNVCPSCRHDFGAPAAAHPEPAAPACCAAAAPPVAPAALVLHPINEEFVDAAFRGNEARVNEFIAAGVDANSVDQYGNTALMWASQNGFVGIVQQLIFAGADVNMLIIPPSRVAAAIRPRHPLPLPPAGNALMSAASHGDIATKVTIIRILLAAGADVYNVSDFGRTALMNGVDSGNNDHVTAVPVIRELLAAGAGATINIVNNNGQTALAIASSRGDTAAVQALLAAGAIVEHGKNTPLWTAIDKGYEDVVRLLVDAGANVNAFGPYGKTLLHTVQERRNQSMHCKGQVEYNKWANIERLLKQAGAV
jgi:ankyrin repeat protein